MNKSIFSLLFVIFAFSFGSAGFAAEELVIQVSGHEAGLTYQVLDDGRLLVSAKDAADDPIRGLTAENFLIKHGIKKAQIIRNNNIKIRLLGWVEVSKATMVTVSRILPSTKSRHELNIRAKMERL